MAEIPESTPGREPAPGWRVRHYEILSELGRGGMGILFRARDSRLGREVALKCPLPELIGDPKQRQRFLREARAAASLSHPNIVAILDAFEEDGIPWIVEELVEGQSLRALLATTGRLEPGTALAYAEGICAALEEAHKKRIMHRDVKPANVLLTADHRVLLSDFGLARFIRQEQETVDPNSPTEPTSLTTLGAVLGTPHYMAPEQALGREVDARSDLFALGGILYEMCTGSPPFPGREFGEILDRIIHREPEPISRFSYEVPAELERIIRKAMAKNPDDRYQSAKDMLVDLRVLRKKLEFGSYSGEGLDVPDAGFMRKFLDRMFRRQPALRLGAAAVILAAVGFAIAVIVIRGRDAETESTPKTFGSPVQVTTSPAWERQPALSPDGGRVAYVSNVSGNLDIWVSDARGGPSVRLTSSLAPEFAPAWHADGSHIYYAMERDGRTDIWKVPQLGGDPLLVVSDGTSPAISPDGTRIAFTRAEPSGQYRITVAALDRHQEAIVLTGDRDGLWDHTDPSWSPDGSRICYADGENLWVVPVAGGGAQLLTRNGHVDRRPVWSPDGTLVYFSSYREGTRAIWRVRASDGKIERMTPGTGEEDTPSLSRDGSRLAYATREASRDILVRNLRTGQESVLTGLRYGLMPAFFPDDRAMVFASDRWGANLDLWIQPLERGEPAGSPRRLTDGPGDFSHPVVSPDGRWIAVYRILDEARDVWILPSEGGQPTRITEDPAEDIQPAWSPAGDRLAFASGRTGQLSIWTVEVTEGRAVGIPVEVARVEGIAFAPSWSPDGGSIAFIRQDKSAAEVAVVSLENGAIRTLTNGAQPVRVRWAPASGPLSMSGRPRVLVSGFWRTEQVSLRSVPVDWAAKDGAEAATWIDESEPVEPEVLFGEGAAEAYFDLSPDGTLLAWCRQEYSGDIWTTSAR